MKNGDLVFDVITHEMVLIVEKLSNVEYKCFSPKNGVIKISKKQLIPQTPNNKLINNYFDIYRVKKSCKKR